MRIRAIRRTSFLLCLLAHGHLFSELGIFPSLHCMLLLTLLCSIKLNQWHGCIISQSDIHLFTYPVWLFSPFIDQLLLPSSTNWAVSSYFPLSACMVCERLPPPRLFWRVLQESDECPNRFAASILLLLLHFIILSVCLFCFLFPFITLVCRLRDSSLFPFPPSLSTRRSSSTPKRSVSVASSFYFLSTHSC